MLKEVYDAPGIKSAVNFKLSAGIRGPEHTHAGYKCVDEDNCDEETYFVCAQSLGASVDFLDCMDSSKLKSAAAKTRRCATSNTPALDWSKISSCFSGPQGTALKKAAALYFDKRFPNPVGIPHIEINGKAQTTRTKEALIKALCATGIQAAACGHAEFVVV